MSDITKGYILNKNGVARKGLSVDTLLDKIDSLENASISKDGIMSKNDKQKLDSLEDDEELTIAEIAALLDD